MVMKHNWKAANYISCVWILIPLGSFVIKIVLHNSETVFYIHLCSFAVSSRKGLQLDDHMTFSDLEIPAVHYSKIFRRYFFKITQCNMIVLYRERVTKILVWINLNPWAHCERRCWYFLKWCSINLIVHLYPTVPLYEVVRSEKGKWHQNFLEKHWTSIFSNQTSYNKTKFYITSRTEELVKPYMLWKPKTWSW